MSRTKRTGTKDTLQSLWASSMGLSIVVATLIGLGIGLFIDKRFSTSPWGTIIFFIIGVVAGFWEIIKEIVRVFRDQKKDV